ncbi:MAG: copper-binding protein [Nitrospirae bacterium]|nr:copper-binding protein [Nitrospirota bacterium]
MSIMKKVGLAVITFAFVMGLALSSEAAREVVSGTVEKVDAMKGTITLKSASGPRDFTARKPEKLQDIKVGDKISLTVQEDGSLVIEKAK